MTPAVFGLAGPALTADERAFHRDSDPAGFVLFRRNCETRAQLSALTASLRDLLGRDLPIFVDQEGGRVARLQPPEWPDFPAAGRFAALWELAPASAIEAVRHNARAMALTLREVGVNVDLYPALDLRHAGAHEIVGDRAFGADPIAVAALGRAALLGLSEGGVAGVIKHMPGHGRANVDSHLALPVVTASDVELEADIRPFRTLCDAPIAVTAHVVYTAWDAERPATLSPIVVQDVIRGRIGFDGLLLTDDIDMKALSGTAGAKGAAALAAGVDLVLDCWARLPEMEDIASSCPPITDAARGRLDRAMASIGPAEGDAAWHMAERDRLLALA